MVLTNGLSKHQKELQVVIDIEDIDVCLLSHTHLTNQSEITLKGYKVYHALHPTDKGRGGSAVIVKQNIKHHVLNEYEETDIQSMAICIHTKRYKLTIASIYCPPRHIIKRDKDITFFKIKETNSFLGVTSTLKTPTGAPDSPTQRELIRNSKWQKGQTPARTTLPYI